MKDPTDHDPLDALRARADRGEPRGAHAVLGAARATDADDAFAPAPAPSPRRHRALGVAAAVLVIVAVAGGVAATRRADSDRASDHPFCAVLERPAYPPSTIDADLVIFIEPGADAAAVDGMRSEIEADGAISEARYIGVDETYKRFRELFADQDVMLANVDADELPTSFEVTLVEGASSTAETARWRRDPRVFEVRDLAEMQARVLDFIVWVGSRPPRPTGGSAELGFQPSPSAWEEHAGDLRAVADPDVAAAIDELTEVAARRGGAVDGNDPSYERAEAATAVIEAAAARDCRLHPLPLFTPDGTEHAVADTTPVGGSAPTTTAVPVFGN